MRAVLNRGLSSRFAKPIAFVIALLPFIWLVAAAVFDWLGANPAEALERSTGDWTLRMLCVVLAITPIRTMAGLPLLARFRRMAGLFVYFYAALHLVAYSWFDMGFELVDIAKDIVKRPFILVGFTAFVLLTPLALTSFNRAIRALGGLRWQMLHRLVYVVAVLAVVHFFWMRAGKNNFAEVAVYALILGSLLGWRAVRFIRKKTVQPSSMQRNQL
ncbi:MAG: protein-methionine-sulfoxide reductase heme-binding subunit MsrQ [Pseudomonadota bacterium]